MPEFTDHDRLLLNVAAYGVMALAEKLTGEKLTVVYPAAENPEQIEMIKSIPGRWDCAKAS